MASPTLLILAAGMGSRYGGLKQIAPIGPGGETILEYSIFDALRAGFGKVVFVLRKHMLTSFQELYAARFTSRVPVDYAFQELDRLPFGFVFPSGRTKPWGTTHAVLAAAQAVREPFAVINADDFYGADGFRVLAQHLKSGSHDYAMAGFTLEQTLSEHGTVARGVCEVTPDNYLRSITELTGIERRGDQIIHTSASGEQISLTGHETVSMNMWAFTTSVFAQLAGSFTRFLAANGTSQTAECYLPTSINELIVRSEAHVKVLPAASQWLGVTYREDHPRVAAGILALVRAGLYPERLWQ